jgi:hypothetical protein
MAAMAAWFIVTHPAELIASARASLLIVLLNWAIMAGIFLLVYLALSLEDFAPILTAAILSAVPAMWFVPALALLGTRDLLWTATGLLLVSNSVRLLILRALSRRDELSVKRRRRRSRPEKDDSNILIFGAMALQAGIAWVWFGAGLIAAILVATGIATWTLAAISRGVYRPRKKTDSVLRAVLTLILAVAIAGLHKGQSPVYKVARQPARRAVTRVFAPAREVFVDGVDGVILRPEVVRPLSVTLPRVSVRIVTPSRSLIGFSGEYRLYPASTRDLKKHWSYEKAAPVNVVYATVSGGPLQTEAYQKLDPPVDFSACRALQVILVSHEQSPAAVTVQLVGDRPTPELGPEIFGLGQSSEETIEFTLPDHMRQVRVNAIRVLFNCIQEDCSRSLRVAVLGFRIR